MEVRQTELQDLLILQPQVFGDSRGYFFESYNENTLKSIIGDQYRFVQDNQSLSSKGVLRGMHFQVPPHEQGKLVRVIKGAVYDVSVDIRKNSPTYGQHFGMELSEENQTMLWIPPGFAHGFLTLRDETIFFYKCTGFYAKQAEQGIMWNDPDLGIEWNAENPILSQKDGEQTKFADFKSPFA